MHAALIDEAFDVEISRSPFRTRIFEPRLHFNAAVISELTVLP